ncbi:hypothetical protein B0J18DRAFT_435480 [Chaetomium sp. MPI-SDFR-AT-0129]|nr:hypothetical protein B0J18DRAFT_435480 [Chaetomium sp. MPI-SDFR-AT-0129]
MANSEEQEISRSQIPRAPAAQRHGSTGTFDFGWTPVMARGRPSNGYPPVSYTGRGFNSSSSSANNSNNNSSDNAGYLEPRPADAISHPSLRVAKSRTFSSIPTLAPSFSEGPFYGQRKSFSVSRKPLHASAGPTYNNVESFPWSSQHPRNQQSRDRQDGLTLPDPSTTSPPDAPIDPKAVSKAMPVQYWAGRFMSLYDHLYNELLEPDNLARLCETPAGSLAPDTGNKASAAAQNNPSISAYGVPRAMRADYRNSGHTSGVPPPSRIPQSATSNAILQSSAYNSRMPGLASHSQIAHPTFQSLTSRHPLPTMDENTIPEHAPAGLTSVTDEAVTTIPSQDKTTHTNKVSLGQGGGLHDSDDVRVRRIFAQLKKTCVTDEALLSFHKWQVLYARKTGRTFDFFTVVDTSPKGAAAGGAGSGAPTLGGQGQPSNNMTTTAEDTGKRGAVHGRGHEFGKRGREMVKRIKRSLMGGSSTDGSTGNIDVARERRVSKADGGMIKEHSESEKGYAADLDSPTADDKEKGRRNAKRFNFF